MEEYSLRLTKLGDGMSALVSQLSTLDNWLTSYRAIHSERLQDPGFAAWLESDYVPIAGGWQY